MSTKSNDFTQVITKNYCSAWLTVYCSVVR